MITHSVIMIGSFSSVVIVYLINIMKHSIYSTKYGTFSFFHSIHYKLDNYLELGVITRPTN